jgi:hypothetical protein
MPRCRESPNLGRYKSADSQEQSAWKLFWQQVLQSGKRELPNPNPETRSRYPKISVGYLLNQKDPVYMSAKAQIWREYQTWLGKHGGDQPEEPVSERPVQTTRDVKRGDAISWVNSSGNSLTGIVERVISNAIRVVQTTGENAGEVTFIRADAIGKANIQLLPKPPPDPDLEKPLKPSKTTFEAPGGWDLDAEVTLKAKSLYPDMLETHGDFFRERAEHYSQDAQKMKDSFVGIDRAVWEQRSPAEKIVMFMDDEVAEKFVTEVLTEDERFAWSDSLSEWQESSSSAGAMRMIGAMGELDIPHTIREDTPERRLSRWEGSQDTDLKSALAKAMAYSQAFYDSLGVDSVHVFRGTGNEVAERSPQGTPFQISAANPITSFSIRPSTSYGFGKAWLAVKVPSSRLFLSPATWPGFASWEHEYVVPGLQELPTKVMPKRDFKHEYDPELMKLARILRRIHITNNSPISNRILKGRPMRSKKAAYQHYWTVRGSGFDEKQWRAILRATRSVVENAAADGIEVDATYRSDVIKIAPKSISKDSGAEPLRLYKNDGGAETYNAVCTDMEPYDPVVVSILTVAKKIAPDVIEITSDGGTDVFGRKYATRLLEGSTHRQPVHQNNSDTMLEERRKKQEIESIRKKKEDAFRQMVKRQKWRHPKTRNMVEYVTLPWEERKAIRSQWDDVYGKHFDEALRLRQRAEKYRKKTEEAAGAARQEAEKGMEKGKQIPPGLKEKQAMRTEILIRKAAIRVAAETSDGQLRRALLDILAKDLPPEFLKNIKKKKEDSKSEDSDKSTEKPWESKKAKLQQELFALYLPQARASINAFYSLRPTSRVANASTATRVHLADKLAKKWIQDAIEHPGRVRKYLKKKPGEKITQSELDEAIQNVEKTDNTSLLRALQMAKTLIKM